VVHLVEEVLEEGVQVLENDKLEKKRGNKMNSFELETFHWGMVLSIYLLYDKQKMKGGKKKK